LGGWDEMGLDPSILVGYEVIVVSRRVGLVFDDILVGFDAALSRLVDDHAGCCLSSGCQVLGVLLPHRTLCDLLHVDLRRHVSDGIITWTHHT
jgi:hypothetical protein